ncbi:unnamed protein product [Periconia digitata]|uniref:Utp8 beta-propeller domain-containing protein n=1 Tax=Periconia digitata TaxID=1303443 RepID=A0A9W4UTW1_9PLEO|nr:unnamed protein product [Periconia digitata]
MASHQAIGAPYTLATLPHAIGKSGGRPHAACVCSISSGIKKKKRTEIAVGLDGEGISIYSIQNPHLATSYALPPQTSFIFAPYSIYRKGNSKSSPCRFTYAFVQESTPGAKAQLVCFTEEIRKDNTSDIVKTSYTLSGSNHQVVAIDSLPVKAGGSQQDASHDVLVVFENGDVICLSFNLEVVRWVANLKTLSPSHGADLRIEHVSLSTAKSITHGLLRNRQDIAAVLNPALDEQSDLLDLTQVLSVVCKQPDSFRTMGLFRISPRSPDITTSQMSPVKHLTSWNLPFPSSITQKEDSAISYVLHANTGALHVLYGSDLLSFDLAGTLPKLTSVLAVSDVRTFLRISQDLLFTTSPKACQVLDSKYSSVQAELPLTSSLPTPSKDSRKRKHAEPDATDNSPITPTTISYYADLGLVVGTRDSEIIGIQLEINTSRKRVKTEGTRLIDSIGKGIKSSADDTKLSEHEKQKWQDRMSKLDKYASKGKIARFESLIASDLGIELEKGEDKAEDNSSLLDTSELVNGQASAKDSTADTASQAEHDSVDELPRKWKLPRSIPEGQRLRYKRYALYALSRIFRWIDSPSVEDLRGTLGVDFFPPNVFQWILQSGYLTKDSIRRAMLDDPTSSLSLTTPIRDGEIVRAMVDFDPELHILSAILNHSHYLPIGEVVQAIKLLMQSLDDQPENDEGTRLLTNGESTATDAMDVDIASEMEAASKEIIRAQAMLENGLTVRSSTLRPALIRLHTFPTPVISSTLRSMLPRHDLESLIRLLHHEFRNGGWTSPYHFTDSEALNGNPQPDQADDSAVAIVASLLSCTLDAIGPATWLTAIGGSAANESTEELIFDLLEDTSIALNGFWEATYIRGLVSELLRYSSKVPKSKKPSQQALQAKNQPYALALKPDELPMLPVGAKPDMGVEKSRSNGKRKERSAREMGMLISQRVPKYSFERIVI